MASRTPKLWNFVFGHILNHIQQLFNIRQIMSSGFRSSLIIVSAETAKAHDAWARTHSSQKQGSRALMSSYSCSKTAEEAESSSNVLQHRRVWRTDRTSFSNKPEIRQSSERREKKKRKKQNINCSVLFHNPKRGKEED